MFRFLSFTLKRIYISVIQGKHSLEYVNLFKKNDLRSPFTPCIKDEFIFHVLMFIKKSPKAKTFNTSDKIQFRNVAFSKTYKELFDEKGIPFCFNAMRTKNHEIKIIGYQELYDKTKLKSLYFFVDNKFVVGEYVFSDIAKIESYNVSEVLIKKYISESFNKLEEFYIEDTSKNMIYFRDNGFELSVKYCNYSNSEVRKALFEIGRHMLPDDQKIDKFEDKLSDIF